MRSVCMYAYMYCMYVCIYVWVCTYVYIYVCMYVCIYVLLCDVMLCYDMGRCDMCPVAFCEDCLPATHEIIGPLSERWAPLGFRPLRYVYMYVCMYVYIYVCMRVCGGRSGCFIFCSPECKQFGIDMAEREKADSSQVRSTPLLLSLTNKLYVCM